MKLAKSLLLGSAAALVATAGNAADLPSKKAAPVQYVKVCDAYGAGFFVIPGTDTCIKVGGRVRADFALSAKQTVYSASYTSTTASTTYTSSSSSNVVTATTTTTLSAPNTASAASNAQNVYGWETRGRVDFDARTQTGYGTVQTVASVRLARTTGTLDVAMGTAAVAPANNSSSTLEAAYIRFAGFTFGAARDNFSFMPSTFYGAGHWASFANGAKQIAYTAVLGGGFSATIAMQDAADTSLGGVTAGSYITTSTTAASPSSSSTFTGAAYSYNNLPQINGRVDFDQAWGSAAVMGAVAKAVADNATGVYTADKTVWAVGAGAKFNLPMIAAGDVLYLNAAYADGMTEYTTNWTSFKGSDTKRNVGGYTLNHPSWINTYEGTSSTISNGKIETLKSWDVAALYTHFWTPMWRHSVLASYGKIDGTTTSKQLVFGQAGAFGDATVWNIGTQLAFVPTKDFEIGVDVLYARVEQDVRKFTSAGIAAATGSSANNALNAGLNATGGTAVSKEKSGNWTGRLRVERTF